MAGRLSWILLLGALGCSDGPDLVHVRGQVTHKGQPVQNLVLHFQPEHGRPSWAETDADGQFQLNYSRDFSGGLVGTHKVWVTTRPRGPGEEHLPTAGNAGALAEVLAEYGNPHTPQITIAIRRGQGPLILPLDGGPIEISGQ